MAKNEDFYKDKVVEIAEVLQKKRLAKRGITTDEVEPTYVIYARRSTKPPKNKKDEDKVDKQETSVPEQIETCRKYAIDHNLKVLDVEEEAETAHKSGVTREVFERILKTIKQGNSYNSILAWHPDRLARNMRDSGEIIDLLDSGVIVDLKFPSFTFVNDPSGKMALGIQFVLAKNYSDGLSVTTLRGIDKKIEKGLYTGKPKHGYMITKDKRYRPHQSNFTKVKKIWDKALEGYTARVLASYSKDIGYPMNYKTILNMLHDPFYAGINVHGTVITDMCTQDANFKPMISCKDFVTIDRNISDRVSFEYSEVVKNILFKRMVKCNYCNRYMSPYKAPNRYKEVYYYVECKNPDCECRKVRGIKKAIRGKYIVKYITHLLEKNLNITEEIYNDAVGKYSSRRTEKIEILNNKIHTLQDEVAGIEASISGLSRSLREGNKKGDKEIARLIREDSEVLADKNDEIVTLEADLITLESKVSDDVIPYEKFLNFFKKADKTIKSNKNIYLLDQLIRNIFLNFFIEDGNVVGHRLREPFATYENLEWETWGG